MSFGLCAMVAASAQTAMSVPAAAHVQVLTVQVRRPHDRSLVERSHGPENRGSRGVEQAGDQDPVGLRMAERHGGRSGRWREQPEARCLSRGIEHAREEGNRASEAAALDLQKPMAAMSAMSLKAVDESVASSKGQVMRYPPVRRKSRRTRCSSSSSSSGTSAASGSSSSPVRRRRRSPRRPSPPPGVCKDGHGNMHVAQRSMAALVHSKADKEFSILYDSRTRTFSIRAPRTVPFLVPRASTSAETRQRQRPLSCSPPCRQVVVALL